MKKLNLYRIALFLALLFTFTVGVVQAQSPPPGVQDLAEDELTLVPQLEVWGSAVGDSAWVVDDSLWRFRSQDWVWSQKCPGEMSFQECADYYDATVDTLVSGVPSLPGDGILNASECLTAVDNATVHIPTSVLAESQLSVGDTIATHAPNGTCVGYGIVEDGSVTLAVVGEQFMVEKGIPASTPINVAVYPSGGDPYPAEVEWAACSTTGVPEDVCRDDGRYEHDTFQKVASITSVEPT